MRFPRAEPETSAEPETKAEHSPEPTSEPGPEPEANAPNAEPVPVWADAAEIWGGAWELHYIGFAVLFFCIALWGVFSLLQARKRTLLVTRRFCYAVNLLLIGLGTTRGLVLLLYPYELVANARGTPVVLARLLFGVGFPCLSAGFTLIHFAFLDAAQIRLHRRHIQSLRFILGVICLHFVLEGVSQIMAAYVKEAGVLLIICMVYFIILALTVSVSMLYSGFKVINASKVNRRTMRKISRRDRNPDRAESARKGNPGYANKESNTHKVAHVTIVTAVLGIACASAQLYALGCVFKVMRHGAVPPEPWPWWVYQTIFRLIELAFAFTMAYTVAQPKKGSNGYFKCCFDPKTTEHTDLVMSNASAHTNSDTTSRKPSVIHKSNELIHNGTP